jgi:hypothetical protein
MQQETPDPSMIYRNGGVIEAELATWRLIRRGFRGDDLRHELVKARVPAAISDAIRKRAKV